MPSAPFDATRISSTATVGAAAVSRTVLAFVLGLSIRTQLRTALLASQVTSLLTIATFNARLRLVWGAALATALQVIVSVHLEITSRRRTRVLALLMTCVPVQLTVLATSALPQALRRTTLVSAFLPVSTLRRVALLVRLTCPSPP